MSSYIFPVHTFSQWEHNLNNDHLQLKYDTDPYFFQLRHYMKKDCMLIYIFCSCCEPEFVQRQQQKNSLCKCRKYCTKSLIDPMSNGNLNGANIDPFSWTFFTQVVIAELPYRFFSHL